MNEIFLIGKIITNIDFDFIINSKKNKSIAKFTVESMDKQNIYILAYNEDADFAYSKLKKNEQIFIYGYLNKNSYNSQHSNKKAW